jgi:dienelactone hydrolase
MNQSRLLLAVCSALLGLTMKAKIVSQSVPYEDNGVKLEGYLAYDDAAGTDRRPGILIVHEWWGLNDYVKGRARQLAGLGYVAFALDMYGKGEGTTNAKKAAELAGQFYGKPLMAQRAQAGLAQLLATGRVDESRVAAIGYCFGGSTVQALAFSGAPLAGIVSFHGGLIPVPEGAAARTKAKILICHGANESFETKQQVDAFLQAMRAGKFDFQFIMYSGAVHAFTNPEADRLARANHLEGGIGYNREADRRSWAHMQQFFDEIFARPSS